MAKMSSNPKEVRVELTTLGTTMVPDTPLCTPEPYTAAPKRPLVRIDEIQAGTAERTGVRLPCNELVIYPPILFILPVEYSSRNSHRYLLALGVEWRPTRAVMGDGLQARRVLPNLQHSIQQLGCLGLLPDHNGVRYTHIYPSQGHRYHMGYSKYLV